MHTPVLAFRSYSSLSRALPRMFDNYNKLIKITLILDYIICESKFKNVNTSATVPYQNGNQSVNTENKQM